MSTAINAMSEHGLFGHLVHENRFDLCKLVYIIFPFGQKGHELEHKRPRAWQMKEWARMSKHLQNPETRYEIYKLVISTGNGSGKSAFGAMTTIMLLYSQKLKGRLTANTKPQLTQVVWPEYDKWFRNARYSDTFFEKFGESIKSKDQKFHDQWQFSLFTWDAANPAAVSGLHNEGHATMYVFEEAPGIPANIFQYAIGAFSDTNTIKFWLVFGNSDDPDSKFEQLMSDPDWHSLRIDTRTLENVDKNFIASVLRSCGGDEDADDFRVRVRGLPRKTNADSIISRDKVREGFERRHGFAIESVKHFPSIITVDPAWQGGDLTVVWWHQGHYSRLMAAYALDKALGEDHRLTYDLVCRLEKELKADAVWIDKGEGTALKTFANQDQKYNWELVDFGSGPNDEPDRTQSQYGNMRAQLHYMAANYFMESAPVLDVNPDLRLTGCNSTEEVIEKIIKQMGYTKADRHKITNKKTCESKKEIKTRVGESPDLSDGYIIRFFRVLLDRMEENQTTSINQGYGGVMQRSPETGGIPLPESVPNYDMHELMRNTYGR